MFYQLNEFGTIDISDRPTEKDLPLNDEQYNILMQSYGNHYTFKLENNEIIPVFNQSSRDEERIIEIQERLTNLSQDIIQMQAGAVFDDEEDRIKEFQDLHNELRQLLGKAPRIYVDEENY